MNISENFLKTAIDSQKYVFQDYIEENEKYLSNKLSFLQIKEQTLITSGNTNALEEFWDSHDGDYYRFSTSFPNILRKSIIVFIYSNFEHYLNQFCECEQYSKNISIQFVKGDGIFKSTGYINAYCGISTKKITNWKEILCFNKIRNAIMHKHSIIEEKDISSSICYINKYVELIDVFTDKDGKALGKIRFNKSSLEYFNSLIHNFMKELFKNV
jgi:hypothetical protein